MKLTLVFLGVVVILLGVFAVNVLAGDVMTVEVDVYDVDSGQSSGGNGTVSVEVPDYIDFGDVDEGGSSDELLIYINNTGNTDILVTPELVNNDEIFENLYFRYQKTHYGIPVEQTKIGDWSLNISAPSSGGSKPGHFYVQLDLSDSGLSLDSDMVGHTADVRFVATAI